MEHQLQNCAGLYYTADILCVCGVSSTSVNVQDQMAQEVIYVVGDAMRRYPFNTALQMTTKSTRTPLMAQFKQMMDIVMTLTALIFKVL